MMEFIMSEGGRLTLLVLALIGFAIQWDLLIEAIRDAKKGGDGNSEEKPSPPEEEPPASGSSEPTG